MDLSIIELFVYGLVCYAGVIGLIVSAFRSVPTTQSQSMTRVIWLVPSMFCAYILASAGSYIYMPSETITNLTRNLNTTEVWSETIQKTSSMQLLDPIWVTIHMMFFLILMLYIIINIIIMLTRIGKD